MKKIYTLAGFVLLSAELSAQTTPWFGKTLNGSDTWQEVAADYKYVTHNDNPLVWDLSRPNHRSQMVFD